MRMLSLAPRISRPETAAGALFVALGAVFLGGAVSRTIGVSRIRVLSRAYAGTVTTIAKITVPSHMAGEAQNKREFIMFAIGTSFDLVRGLISLSCVEAP